MGILRNISVTIGILLVIALVVIAIPVLSAVFSLLGLIATVAGVVILVYVTVKSSFDDPVDLE